jgi:hypothetical protein
MAQIDIEAAKAKLREIAKNYRRPLHGKLALLALLKDELLRLRNKGASIAEIAGFLAECKIILSMDTVRRFFRAVEHPRPRKPKATTVA